MSIGHQKRNPQWAAVAWGALPQLAGRVASSRDWGELKDRFAAGAAVPRLDGSEPLARRMVEDTARWTQVIKTLGIKPE